MRLARHWVSAIFILTFAFPGMAKAAEQGAETLFPLSGASVQRSVGSPLAQSKFESMSALVEDLESGSPPGTTTSRATVATNTPIPGAGSFKAGVDFETTLATKAGNVQVISEVGVNGSELVIKDLIIYGENGSLVNQVGAREFVALKNQVVAKAASEGFTSVRFTGTRVAGSPSAAPGKVIDIVVQVKK